MRSLEAVQEEDLTAEIVQLRKEHWQQLYDKILEGENNSSLIWD